MFCENFLKPIQPPIGLAKPSIFF